MSSVMRPSGPLPSRVYWVRRLVLLAILLLAVLLVWWLAGKVLGGGDPAQAATPPASTNTPTSTASTGQHHGGTGQQHTGKHHGSSRHGHRQAQPTGACDPADVAMTVVVKDMTEGASNPVKLELTSTGVPACTLAITPDALALRITSGRDLIWSSDSCPDQLLAREVVVRRQPTTTYTFSWDGHRSTDTCSAPGKVATPGGYWAEAALIGADAHRAYFDVR